MMKQVKKRNGSIVEFEEVKITDALRKAFASCDVAIDETALEALTAGVLEDLSQKYSEEHTPSVENVQDLVELALMEAGHMTVAKHYIVYRYEHTKIREEKKQETLEKIEEEGLLITTASGKQERFNETKLRQTLAHFAEEGVTIDVEGIMTQLKYELYEGMSTAEVGKALIMVVRSMIERDPAYSKLAARLLLNRMYGDVFGSEFDSKDPLAAHERVFVRNMTDLVAKGDLDERMAEFDLPKLARAMKIENDYLFEYMGLEIMSSRYCMEDTKTKKQLETPQMLWMRIAMGLAIAEKPEDRERVALEFYDVLSGFYYTPGGRTLFQSGFKKAQMSNCFLNSVPDSLDGIFKSIADNAQYLKWSGGTGTDWTKVRATGSFIKGTGVGSQGIVPFLKIANDVNIAINRSGKRRGAGCVYLETWHLDVEDFFELRKNTGDERRRTHDINTANWIPDLFMKRVRDGGQWTLFSPNDVPDLHEIYGAAFEKAYIEYEAKVDNGEIELFKRVSAADLWKKMIGMLFETGHPWITWKDPSNIRSPQDHAGVVHNSNLCTEITLNTSDDETAVCTLGSLNFAKFVTPDENGTLRFDHELVGKVTRVAIRMLDNVIDLNFYPTVDSYNGNTRHRPVGLGVRGYHDALYMLNIQFDSTEALAFADESMEVVAYYAILGSSELAKERGTYSSYKGSKWDRGLFPQDTVDLLEKERGEEIKVKRGGKLDWTPVREHVKEHGMRNSNTMAIAPTASTANLVGCIPCVEPIYKNIYVKSNKEGEFVVVNKYLVEDLKKAGLWSPGMLNRIKYADGSIQDIDEVPLALKEKYKEVFEIDGKWLVEAAARRGKWIDQSQSLNIFYNGTSGRDLSDIYFLAWQMGLKTTYYLRTLGASQVEKATVSTSEYGSTHNRKAGVVTAQAVAVETVEVIAEPSVPSGFTPEEWQAKMSRVAAGEEAGVCESCES
ncbi:ribonucleoside-diphosphate reductase subunit alpha [Patescibacteria group bacterium]|nr:ribonucleoside-diphosphate reductase subunit alpha [Patescibacteria group bacterium]MBU1501030.1 ribonucleoside-diphosphate reductase subunit alpha [Patescibacteria group bacterium]MBU2080660.1 ribonucleoside-diphosphate reductase subunit alpha [Patescibacteria group bacterium]MBU2124265.1 ribonucleoside-diphosphate reductase subunit alpha [Patescibacteria group bacterium]MBU2194391.1 ribonucleoside-diphosphate reductase subunit alpha [Patescibacteria group bacterium]